MQNVALLLNLQHTYYYLFKNLSSSLNIKLSQSRGHACLSVAVSLTPRMVHIFECCKNNKQGH